MRCRSCVRRCTCQRGDTRAPVTLDREVEERSAGSGEGAYAAADVERFDRPAH